MRLSSVLTLIFCLFSIEAFAQARRPVPGPGPVPQHRPRPPHRPLPAPMPRPIPAPRPRDGMACFGADLYRHNWLIHRFVWSGDCHQALRDIRMTGRYCDQASMFDQHGRLLARYRHEHQCRRALGR
jgi:hypothetical protein